MSEIICLTETDSTNNYLKALQLKETVQEGTVVSTGFQSAGKGQRGNSWESEEGKNLTFSIVIYPQFIKAREQFIISQFVSLAIKDFLSQYTDDVSIKWPNDIYWKEKKICGILIENSLNGNTINHCIIGIGLNINQKEFRSNAPNPVSLAQITGEYYDLKKILQNLSDFILSYYEKLKQGNTSFIVGHYKQSLFRRQGYHLYNDGTTNFSACIVDIESDGMLLLETELGERKRFAFKEIKYILP